VYIYFTDSLVVVVDDDGDVDELKRVLAVTPNIERDIYIERESKKETFL